MDPVTVAGLGIFSMFVLILLHVPIGIAMIVFRGRDRHLPIPFGPYLAAAGWIAMLYGDAIQNAYLDLFL